MDNIIDELKEIFAQNKKSVNDEKQYEKINVNNKKDLLIKDDKIDEIFIFTMIKKTSSPMNLFGASNTDKIKQANRTR